MGPNFSSVSITALSYFFSCKSSCFKEYTLRFFTIIFVKVITLGRYTREGFDLTTHKLTSLQAEATSSRRQAGLTVGTPM
jgi:hypothetical protein